MRRTVFAINCLLLLLRYLMQNGCIQLSRSTGQMTAPIKPIAGSGSSNSNAMLESRRRFLATCGRLSAATPPAVTILLATANRNYAIADSSGIGGGGGGGGGFGGNAGGGTHHSIGGGGSTGGGGHSGRGGLLGFISRMF
jgi:uncharacterized membrane protein YgcG